MVETSEESDAKISQPNEIKDAIAQGNKTLVLSFLEEFPDRLNDVIAGVNLTPFEYALSLGFDQLATELLELPNFDIKDSEHSPLRYVLTQGFLNLVPLLVNKGAPINSRKEGEVPLLFLALDRGYLDIADLFLENGAEINVRDDQGRTALMLAAYRGDDKTVDFLLERKANVQIVSNMGFNAQMAAYINGRIETIEKLQKAGSVFSLQYLQAVLMNAYAEGNVQLAKSLLNTNVDPNFEDKQRGSLLALAVKREDEDFIKLLLERGANPNTMDKDGYPLIFSLAAKGKNEFIKIFVQNGASVTVDKKEKQPFTAHLDTIRSKR